MSGYSYVSLLLKNAVENRQGKVHRPRCPECGCKIRGTNHADGSQHRNRVKAKRIAARA